MDQPVLSHSSESTLRVHLLRGLLAAIVTGLVVVSLSARPEPPPVRLRLEMKTNTDETGQVFYAGLGQAHAQDRSQLFSINADGRWHSYDLELPSEHGVSRVRVDPGSSPGNVSIRRVRVQLSGQTVDLRGETLARAMRDVQDLVRRISENGVSFVATGTDPFFDIEIAPALRPVTPMRRALTAIRTRWWVVAGFALLASMLSLLATRRPRTFASVSSLWSGALQRLSPWLLLLPAPLMGLYWSKGHVLPSVICASFTLALLSTVLAGMLAQEWIDGSVRGGNPPAGNPPGVFQLLWIGQYALFALGLAISPFAALFSDLTGHFVPLRVSLPLVLTILALLRARKVRAEGRSWVPPASGSAPLASLVALAIYRALSLHSFHAGALGHDTQQHFYWIQHIADYGYLPIAARGSDLIDYYPRFFHLLSACWSSAGLTRLVGPQMKLMPFLQLALAGGFFVELLIVAQRVKGRSRSYPLLSLVGGLFIAWNLTYGDGQEVYSIADLSATPRISAQWILVGMPLLVLAHRLGTFVDARAWLIALTPILASIALGINPVTVLVYATYSLPVALLLYLFLPERGLSATVRPGRPLAIGCTVSVLMCFANAMVLEKLGTIGWFARILGSLGIRVRAAGISAPTWEVKKSTFCNSDLLTCGYDLIGDVFEYGGSRYFDSLISGRLPALRETHATFIYWAVFSLPLLLIAVRPMRRLLRFDIGVGRRVLTALLLASILPTWIHPLFGVVLERFSSLNPLMRLLWHYYNPLHMFLHAWLLSFLPLSPWVVAPRVILRPGRAVAAWAITAGLLASGLGYFAVPDLANHRNSAQPWTIDWPELRAIEHVNKFVAPHETVLVPASHIFLGQIEHILMAPDPAGLAAVHLTTRLLFELRLGTGIDYNWPDLVESFCASRERRDQLLRAANVRWVLVREVAPRDESVLGQDYWRCGVTLRDLNVEFPAAWSERDLALYRVNP